jgi:hypothetical protein
MPLRDLQAILDEANPNKLPTAAQQARLGSMLALAPRFAKAAVVSGILTLPEDARAGAILAATVTAGTTLGPKTPAVPAATASGIPATTLVTTSPEGHISFNVATDAVTAAEVVYVKEEGEIFEEVITVVPGTGVGAPLQGRNIRRLLEATALTGGVVGACIVDQRGFTVATTKHAAASITGAAAQFLAADAVTSARIKYIATPGVGATKPALGATLDLVDKNY